MSYVQQRYPETAYDAQRAELGDLGFSLKPPKWLRKAQPGKVLAKVAAPAAAIAATALIPGVAPLAAKVAAGAAKGAARIVSGGARLVTSGARSAARLVTNMLAPAAPAPPVPTRPGPAPARTQPLWQRAASRALRSELTSPEQSLASKRAHLPRSIDRVRQRMQQPTAAPAASEATAPASATAAPVPASSAAAPSAAASEAPAVAAPGISPLVIGLGAVGLVAVLAASGRKSRR